MLQIQTKLKQAFSNLVFDEGPHTYSIEGKVLPSTTGMVKQHAPEFDYGLAENTAKKLGKSTEYVLEMWKQNGDRAARNGTLVHQYAEDWWKNPNIEAVEKQEISVRSFLQDITKTHDLVCTELQMYSVQYQYAGTCDLLLWNREEECLELYDYKTNKDLDNSYGNLLAPFPYAANSNYNKYQIQLSYYQLMLEEVGLEVKKRYLVWLKKDGTYELRYCNDFTQTLKDYLHDNR